MRLSAGERENIAQSVRDYAQARADMEAASERMIAQRRSSDRLELAVHVALLFLVAGAIAALVLGGLS